MNLTINITAQLVERYLMKSGMDTKSKQLTKENMKEQIETCRYNKPRIDMVAPHVSGKVDYCTLKGIYANDTTCEYCGGYEPNATTIIREFLKSLDLRNLKP